MSSTPATMRALLLTKAPGATAPHITLTTKHPLPMRQPGHVLVRIHASAIHPSDLLNALGGFGHNVFPRVPGHGVAVFGTSGSTHTFTVDGFQADYAVVPERAVVPKPDSLSHVQAATLGVPFTTAALVVRRSEVKAGDTVLVIGAHGNVGRCVCVLLEEMGCKILRAVLGQGADIDTSADPELKSVSRLAPTGVNAVIDTVGSPSLSSAAIEVALGHAGRLVFIAAPRARGSSVAHLCTNMLDFYRAEKSLVGVNTVSHSSEQMAGLLRELEPLFESGRWKYAVSGEWEEVCIENAAEAYASNDGRKSVITMA
ncbi:GroES-like protein [Venustampulla echinocandica]|uniref:GroES-like protein n=1 Tax=Venustampulla echinocandica TaxID=2656787 RepID=A0A370TLE9_9HELO|nr:GroES-like protein [Venustampulla echinocandica]RDL36317.1 GroES-like protein [Venustampulla echinocandica]